MRPIYTRRHRGFLLLLSLYFIVSLIAISRGWADGELLCDDAYYYFEISRNAALGEGFTFDLLQPTNGFHPLWAWILVPVFSFLPHSVWGPIRIAMGLSSLFVVLTALCISHFFVRRGRPLAGCIGAWVWLLNPFTLVLAFRGVEGPLNTLCIALAFLYLDSIRTRATYSMSEAWRLGAMVGICLLARTDNVLLLVAWGGILIAAFARRRAFSEMLSRGLVFSLALTVVVLPWLLWNLLTFGTVVQTSFRAKSLFTLFGQLPEWWPSTLDGPGALVGALLAAVRNHILIAVHMAKYMMGEVWMWQPIDAGYRLLLAVSVLLGLLAVVPIASRGLRAAWKTYRGLNPSGLLPMGLFCLLHFGWYALIGRNYYEWYFLPPVFATSLMMARRLDFLWSVQDRKARALVVLILATSLVATPAVVSKHVEDFQVHEDEISFHQGVGKRIASHPVDSRLGIWNAGSAGYFASFHYPRHVVINLDGLVNNEVPLAAAEGGYEEYLLENIDALIETPYGMTSIIGIPATRDFLSRHVDSDWNIVAR